MELKEVNGLVLIRGQMAKHVHDDGCFVFYLLPT